MLNPRHIYLQTAVFLPRQALIFSVTPNPEIVLLPGMGGPSCLYFYLSPTQLQLYQAARCPEAELPWVLG